MRGRKAQVTLFMILGVLILGGASFMFYLSSKKTSTLDKEIGVDTKSIENYIDSCLRNSLKRNLLILGEQGGAIYKSQDGLFFDFLDSQEGIFFVKDGAKIVRYLITRPFGHNLALGMHSSAPNYPWIGFPMRGGNETYLGYFGINLVPPLHKVNRISGNAQQYSIEEQLLTAIEKDIRRCSLEPFENEFEIEAKEPSLDLIFDASTTAKLDYPMSVKGRKSGAKKDLQSFSASIPINLPRMHDFVFSIAQQDVQNITYDISKASNSNYVVFMKRNISRYNDIIIVTDRAGKIDNEPFRFQFARENRIPALANVTVATQLKKGQGITATLLNAKAFDPDEDEVMITYLINGAQLSLPYTITEADCGNIQFTVLVNASDGQFSDYQRLTRNEVLTERSVCETG